MKRGFTLVELLVVVLIIGVLSAIAIPMYQGAVDKSHWSTMLPGAKAIKDAEEAIKMTNGSYTDNMANLDVTMNNADLTFALVTPNNTADPNVIRVTNSKLNNVRLASYLDDNPKFAGQLHCEALKNDERANRLCGKLLNGQELTEQDGYVGYLLDQDIDKATCDNASRSWSTSKTKCYKDTATRCEALGMPAISGQDQCGYENGGGKTYGEETICIATAYTGCGYSSTIINQGGQCIGPEGSVRGCYYTVVNEGGVCTGTGANFCEGATINGGACINNGNQGCNAVKVSNGGVCVANKIGDYGNGGCFNARFTDHSVCYANVSGSCSTYHDGDVSSFYDETSCCCGAYCLPTAPKCADRGVTCDPQYLK